MTDSYYEPNQAAGSEGPYAQGTGVDGHLESGMNGSRGVSPQQGYANGTGNSGQGVNGQPPVIRKKLASWVGFSNLPNQVHRRSVR